MSALVTGSTPGPHPVSPAIRNPARNSALISRASDDIGRPYHDVPIGTPSTPACSSGHHRRSRLADLRLSGTPGTERLADRDIVGESKSHGASGPRFPLRSLALRS